MIEKTATFQRPNMIDAVRLELKEIGQEMACVSPKTSLYAKLQARMDVLNTELNRLRALR
jgi:hypothetical protein